MHMCMCMYMCMCTCMALGLLDARGGGGLLPEVEQRRHLRSSQDVIKWPREGRGPGSQATLACALKDSHEDDEVGNNEDGGNEPVDPRQDIDAEQFDDVVELPIDE